MLAHSLHSLSPLFPASTQSADIGFKNVPLSAAVSSVKLMQPSSAPIHLQSSLHSVSPFNGLIRRPHPSRSLIQRHSSLLGGV